MFLCFREEAKKEKAEAIKKAKEEQLAEQKRLQQEKENEEKRILEQKKKKSEQAKQMKEREKKLIKSETQKLHGFCEVRNIFNYKKKLSFVISLPIFLKKPSLAKFDVVGCLHLFKTLFACCIRFNVKKIVFRKKVILAKPV